MLLCKITLFVVLGLAHDLHTYSIRKQVVEHQLCARGSLVLHASSYGHNPYVQCKERRLDWIQQDNSYASKELGFQVCA